MLNSREIEVSTKAFGKFEKPLIDSVTSHFEGLGYECYPHVSFNLAWGNILSDIDVLMIKDGLVTVVEVKSKKDNLRRAYFQLASISDYIDYAYVATDKQIRKWDDPCIGLIVIEDGCPRISKQAIKFDSRPRINSLFGLHKKCLLRMLDNESRNYNLKYDIATQTSMLGDDETLRECIKEIVICGRKCNTDCPIWKFTSSSPLVGPQSLLLESSV